MVLTMSKKSSIGITGTSKGLGLALKQKFLSHGHEVLEFNRSNGYDINDPEKIVQQVNDCDIFINNAYSGFAQVELLYALTQQWENIEHRYIINIGSERICRWNVAGLDWKDAPRGPAYRTHKSALSESVAYLYQQVVWPKLMLVNVGAMDTAPSMYWNDYRKNLVTMPCDQVSDLIYNSIDQRDQYFISEISFRPTNFYKDISK